MYILKAQIFLVRIAFASRDTFHNSHFFLAEYIVANAFSKTLVGYGDSYGKSSCSRPSQIYELTAALGLETP